tara:strand:+ start:1265 stop:2209 length:945 start_codon:yes stop_codon:yes gene_type:complete
MRQAGRYLPEFRDIRSKNPNFIELCLNEKLSSEITLQPLRRFDLDAAIIFSDILLLPYALGQPVNFKKNFGPELGKIDLNKILEVGEKEFIKKLQPVYNSLKITKAKKELQNKDLIGFVGAPWTILLYMLHKKSPKDNNFKKKLEDKIFINDLLRVITKFLKVHIDNQIKSGATIIQIFDSWAGLLDDEDLEKLVYEPTNDLVNFTRSKKVPSICFPKGIKNYERYVRLVKPDVVSIDYNVDPMKIADTIDIVVQGGLNPDLLLGNKENLKKNTLRYLDIFKDKPYIFNLGHGVLPNTDPSMVDYLVKIIKNYQ